MPITLESIKAEQTKIAEMIAAFEAQTTATASIHFPEITIDLAAGEEHAGLIIGKDGEPSHHLILLPGDAEDINWENAKAWAKGQGGELPTRREQSLLFANCKEHFEERAYWSVEELASDAGSAWCQHFYGGYQSSIRKVTHKLNGLRARAVRRLVIE